MPGSRTGSTTLEGSKFGFCKKRVFFPVRRDVARQIILEKRINTFLMSFPSFLFSSFWAVFCSFLLLTKVHPSSRERRIQRAHDPPGENAPESANNSQLPSELPGLNESWLADSMECHTYLRNVQDLLSDGKTPYERRFGQSFKGPIIPWFIG